MICICEPRDALASSFIRLHSTLTIMILSCRLALTIFFGPWPLRHLMRSILYQETSLCGPSHSLHQVDSRCASALPDHCRRGWAPTNQCAHIKLLWEWISVLRSAHPISDLPRRVSSSNRSQGKGSGRQLPWRFVVHVLVAKPEDTLEGQNHPVLCLLSPKISRFAAQFIYFIIAQSRD
jgi:hypothetical protein